MHRLFNRSFFELLIDDTPAIAHRIRLRHLVIAVCGCALLMFLMVRPAFAQTPSGTIDVSFDNRFASGLYFGTQVRTLNFYVKLSTAPNANVTVSITNTNTDVSFSPSTLTFTPSNFSANQTVVVTVTEDSDFVHDSDTLTLTATGGITAPAKTVTANIQDGDVTWLFDPPGGLTITEGTETTIRVRLPFQPSGDVGSNFGLGHAKTYVDTRDSSPGYQTSWSFVASTWDQWVTIRVVAEEEDDDYFDDMSHISVNGDRGAGGGLYESASALYPITITDNDDNLLEITPAGTLNITEGDATGGSFSVTYGYQPGANRDVVVALSKTNADVTLNPTSLTFTSTNHSIPQTVTVTAASDADGLSETDTVTFRATITHPPVGTTPSVVQLKAINTRTVSIADSSSPSGAIEVTPTGTLSIAEGDSTGGTLSVKLSAAPNADVTVTLSKTNPDVTLSPTTLTFTSGNYSVAQTVTVTAADDVDVTDDTDTITFSATGGITASNVTKAVAIDDDEPPAGTISVSPAGTLNIDEGDATGGTLSISLSTQPDTNVTVTLSKTNADVTLSPTTLTFTSGNYSVAQTVTVTAADDADFTDDTDTITFSATGGITAPNTAKGVAIDDDDLPAGTINVTPAGALNIDEGDSTGASISVSLSAAPNAAVTVALTSSNSDVTLSPASLSFNASNHSTAQSVTITAGEDSNNVNETVTITLTATGGITASSVTKTVNVSDNDAPSGTINVTPAGDLSITEGDATGASISVSLGTAPNADVTVSLTSSNSDVSFSPTSLSFTASNHSTAQSVTITAAEDSDTAYESATITLSATGGIVASNVTKTVNITDNDKPSGTINVTPAGDLAIDEGDSTGASISVSLGTAPNANVTIALTASNSDVNFSPASLTFTASNHSTAQSVTITAAEDNDTVHESATITLAATGGITASNVTKTVNITDNDKPSGAITVTPAGDLAIDEGDSTGASISVSLDTAPNADVTVALTSSSSDVSLSPTSLTFTASDHSTAQSVTVTAVEDNDTVHEIVTITLAATGGIDAPNVTKTVNVTDNDKPSGAITVTPAGDLDITEGDSTGATLSVSLDTAPNANVTVALTASNTDVTFSPSSLSFTASNHSTAQTVTVTAAEDSDTVYESATITLAATGGIDASNVTKTVNIMDNDKPPGAITVTPAGDLDITEGDSTGASLSVSLDTPPNADVTVALTASNTDVTLSPASLTFTASNHSTAQTVTVTAAEDSDTVYETATITLAATGGIIASNVTKTVNIMDNDKPSGAITVTPAGDLDITEGDSTGASLSVSLDTAPNADVTIALTSSNTDVSFSPSSLTFTASNHSTAQSVTVTAAEDSDTVYETATITLAATGGIIASNVTKTVNIMDNDKPPGQIVITPGGALEIDEGDATGASMSVTLDTAPNADVTVTLTSSSADVTASPASLTFTASNYSTAQSVTVTAAVDDNPDHETVTITLVATGGIDAPNVTKTVNVTDSEDPTGTIIITPTGALNIDEGDTTGATLSISFGTAPNADVTVTLTKTNDDVTLNPTTLTFTTANYSTAQTVTVTAAEDDDDAADETDIITISATGGINVSNVRRAVNIDDNEAPVATIDVTPTGTLIIDEGDASGGTLSVMLSAEPDADVTVTLSKTNADVTLSPTSLTFTTDNYSTAQTVTVTAADDGDTVDDTDTITLSATGGITASDVTRSVAITDVDSPSGAINVVPTGALRIEEGASLTLSVSLGTQPDANVTVTLSKTNDDLTLNPTSLTFTISNYSIAQSVTVSAGQDTDSTDDTDTITVSATGGIVTSDITRAVTIEDGDNPSGTIDVTPAGTLNIDEGDSSGSTLSVSLSVAPKSNVTVTLSKTNADVTLSPTSLSFTPSNYSTAQTVTVTADDDPDAADETDTITLWATGGITAANVTRSIAIADDDPPLGTIDVTPAGGLSIDEGDVAGETLSISLDVAPISNVTVTLSKTNADVILSSSTLTFTPANHATAQTVTVTADHDIDTDDDTDTITLAATGGISASNVTRSVAIEDDDTPSTPIGTIRLAPAGALVIDEGGSRDLWISLSAAPNADVILTLTGTNADISFSEPSLLFTASNWNTARTVVVFAAQDGDADNDTGTILLSATGGINAPSVTRVVSLNDDDIAARLLLTPSGTLTVDEGTSQTFTVRLSVKPKGDVTVVLSSPDYAAIDLDETSLVFTPSNWNTPRAIAVFANHDDNDTDETDTITLTATGGDIIAPAAKMDVRVKDDDIPGGLSLSPTGSLEVIEGGRAAFGISLAIKPNTRKSVEIVLSNTNPDLVLSPGSLTFTDRNWNQVQSVTLIADDDEDVDDDSDRIEVATFGEGNYAQIKDASIPVRIFDSPGEFALSPPTLTLIEGGEEAWLEARLEVPPVNTSRVSMTFTADRSGIKMTPSILIFPVDSWDTPRRISVRAIDDLNTREERVTITAVAVGGNYRRVERKATALLQDDDYALQLLPPVKTRALALPPSSAQDSAVMRVRCRQDSPCDVMLDCHAQSDGSTFEALLPEPIPAWGSLALTAEDIERYTGASWAGKGRLGCSLRSEGELSAQVWTRSGDGVLVNNSAFIRSIPEGDDYRADIESIPEPGSLEKSNFRIRCEARPGEDCTATRFACYDDAGRRYDGYLGTIVRWHVRHLQTSELVDIIDHRWQGMGLSCEMRSSAPFTVQVLTRTGGGGALVNNSATGAR